MSIGTVDSHYWIRKNVVISLCIIFQVGLHMDKQEAYSLLGVESGDKLRDVRRKYHLLMHMHHPDVLSENGNADTARKLNEAYEILNDDS